VFSHFEFVSELRNTEALKERLSRSARIKGIGFANLYTSLGPRESKSTMHGGNMPAPPGVDPTVSTFLSAERTFCKEPEKCGPKYGWYKMVNTQATDEVTAHTGMFSPKTNVGYFEMSHQARDLVVHWVGNWT